MATVKELEAKVEQLEAFLAQLGLAVQQSSDLPEERPDYIAHGSPAHAAFIGLVPLDDPADADGRVTYTSRETGRVYCLEDELGILRYYPGIDPEKAALVVPRQKVGAFEGGVPPVPENAPSLWTPTPTPFAGIGV